MQDDQNQNKNNMTEKERNDQNNANNIRNAAAVASKTKNPYAMAAGKAIQGLDKVTGGKSTQALGRGMSMANRMTPGGRLAQNLSNKASESGASDKVGNAASQGSNARTSYTKRINNKKKEDDSETPMALKNKKKNGLYNRFASDDTGTSNNNDNDNKEEDSSEDTNDDSDNQEDDSLNVGGSAAINVVKLLPILLPFAFMFILIILLFVVYETFVGKSTESVNSILNNFIVINVKAEGKYVTPEGTKEREQEIAYNNALIGAKDGSEKGIVASYKMEYGVDIDWCLLHALVTCRYTMNLNNINYEEAKNNLEAIAQFMVVDGNTDYEKGGVVYNNLLNSDFLDTYYKEFLIDNDIQTRKNLLNQIFGFADASRSLAATYETDTSSMVASKSIEVELQTCYPTYKYQEINGQKIYGNPSAMRGHYDSISLIDYIAGVAYGEEGTSKLKEETKEGMKAYLIAFLTYIIRDKKMGFDLKTGKMYIPAGNCRQLCCDPNIGCNYQKKKSNGKRDYGTSFSGNEAFNESGWYAGFSHNGSRNPMTATDREFLNGLLDEVFGIIMVTPGTTPETFQGSSSIPNSAGSYYTGCGGGYCLNSKSVFSSDTKGMNYEQILKKYYSSIDFDLINIKEGLYTSEAGEGAYSGNLIFYSQTDYKNVTFCGRSGRSISTSGCGVTSAAIVASSLTGNKTYDPKYMMNLAYKNGYCGAGISGTSAGFYKYFANQLGLSYSKVGKGNAGDVITALKGGKSLVIVHVGEGHFTSGGHYMVLSASNEKGEVYVNDPNHNKHTGWWDINIIANELKSGFYIISK